MKKKIAIVLFNLGGPDKLSSVKQFLFNLFNDKNIITLVNPFRWLIAKLISSRRTKTAQEIYSKIGGSSPILKLTEQQSEALEVLLKQKYQQDFKIFIAMRYWHPFAKEVIAELENFKPDEIMLLPLYPQYSTTTSMSSLDEFKELLANSRHKNIKPKSVCCYFQNENFINAHAALIKEKIANLKGKFRILFSAHGLPEYIIKRGDPYQWQIEQTVERILSKFEDFPKLDYVISYQSKVGPLKWITPSTEAELHRAANDDIIVVVVPIAFVSEHSETLVELDMEYQELFSEHSKQAYIRVPALNNHPLFIECLADQVGLMLDGQNINGACSNKFSKCYKKLNGENND